MVKRPDTIVDTDVLIVGGGAIGIATAYYLASHGLGVTVVEQGTVGAACSWGNAGLIAASQITPLASPRALLQAMEGVFDRSGPVVIRPRLDPGFLRWSTRFLSQCFQNSSRSRRALNALAVLSSDLHKQLAAEIPVDYGYSQLGWLHVFRTESGLKHEMRSAAALSDFGIRSVVLDRTQVQSVEPIVSDGVVGGIHFTDDAHLQPGPFVETLAERARLKGAAIVTGTTVRGFRSEGSRVSAVLTSQGPISCKWLVLAAGAWTRPLGRRLGMNIPIEPAKGHSITFTPDRQLTVPVMLSELHISISPQGADARVTSGLEFAGFSTALSERRLARMLKEPARYIDGLGAKPGTRWVGFRPLTPDDLPIIGPVRRFANVLIGSGHGTLGITLAPGTARIICDQILGSASPIDSRPFMPSRFRV
jgi:D-amino-acid dehydrogenase